MNTTITEVEYLTETKFRAAVKKLLGNSVHSKKETDDMRPCGIDVTNAEGHWATESTKFRVKIARSSSWNQIEIERRLVLAGFEMVKAGPAHANDKSFSIAWRKAAN